MDCLKHKYFDYGFMSLGVLLQVICFLFTRDDLLSFICGVSGAVNVVLCSQRKMSFYLFAYIQMLTYIVIIYRNQLWGELGENIFYFVTTTIAMFLWLKHCDKDSKEVEARKLEASGWLFMTGIFIAGTLGLWAILAKTNDPEPLLDAISTVPAFIAQFLLMFRFREQWVMWLIVDVATLVLWVNMGNTFMVMQYIFWIMNCLYGYYKWS